MTTETPYKDALLDSTRRTVPKHETGLCDNFKAVSKRYTCVSNVDLFYQKESIIKTKLSKALNVSKRKIKVIRQPERESGFYLKGQYNPVIKYLDAIKRYLTSEDYKSLNPITDLAVFTAKDKKQRRLCVNCWDHKDINSKIKEDKVA